MNKSLWVAIIAISDLCEGILIRRLQLNFDEGGLVSDFSGGIQRMKRILKKLLQLSRTILNVHIDDHIR